MESRRSFVGRARELAELEEGLHDAIEGRGRLFLISGEPGIGKTRLADELADRAAARGVKVLWGRCWEGDGAPANWPWIQVVRALAAGTEPATLRSQVGAGAPYLSQLVPEIGAEGLLPAASASPESARFHLFDAVTTLLKRASAHAPLMLVLDDFHAADLPSLRLLQFLARDLREARLLAFVTYRDSEMQARATAGEIVADLIRQGRAVHLQGLSEPDVARLIEGTNGAVPTARLVSAVHGTTEGNPFFIEEMLRHLVESGAIIEREGRWTTDRPPDALGLPAGVREVVGQRLARLSGACNSVLTIAAVVGREFGLDTLQCVSELDVAQALQAIEEAAAAGIVREMPRAVGRYIFSHALIRETLYGALTGTRRVRIHRQIGEVLESLYAAHPEPHLSELAYHFHEAAPGGDVARAVEYARRAAEGATASLAFEEAARLYRLAVQTLEDHAPADRRLRCELLLAQGEAETRAGGLSGATETFQRAADVARELGASEQFARAALGCGGRFVWAIGASDDRLIALLEESLRMLGEEDSVLRVRVLARLATALVGRVLYWRDSLDRSDSLSRQAMEMARRLEDAAVLAYALDARYFALFGPDFVEERLAIATEMVQLAEKSGDRERAPGSPLAHARAAAAGRRSGGGRGDRLASAAGR
jgi:predicted ATPase